MSEFTNGRHPIDAISKSEILPGGVRPGAAQAVFSEMPRERSSRRGMWRYLGGLAFFLGVLAGGRWFVIETDESPILTYVSMVKPLEKAVFFQPDTAKPGEKVQLVFNRTKWLNVSYKAADLIFHATCLMEVERDGKLIIEPRRRDFPSYTINVPLNAGEVETKSRPFEVPADCLPGTMVYRAFARHHRGLLFSDKETRDFPETFLTVVAR